MKTRFKSVLVEKSGAPTEVSHMKLASDDLILTKLQRFLQSNNVAWPSNVIVNGLLGASTRYQSVSVQLSRLQPCQNGGRTAEPWPTCRPAR